MSTASLLRPALPCLSSEAEPVAFCGLTYTPAEARLCNGLGQEKTLSTGEDLLLRHLLPNLGKLMSIPAINDHLMAENYDWAHVRSRLGAALSALAYEALLHNPCQGCIRLGPPLWKNTLSCPEKSLTLDTDALTLRRGHTTIQLTPLQAMLMHDLMTPKDGRYPILPFEGWRGMTQSSVQTFALRLNTEMGGEPVIHLRHTGGKISGGLRNPHEVSLAPLGLPPQSGA